MTHPLRTHDASMTVKRRQWSGIFHEGRYDGGMQPIEIDPELNRLALLEAAQQYPEFAGHALRVVARPLSRGFAWQLEWKGAPPPGQQAWEFQNAAVRAYKRLAGILE